MTRDEAVEMRNNTIKMCAKMAAKGSHTQPNVHDFHRGYIEGRKTAAKDILGLLDALALTKETT